MSSKLDRVRELLIWLTQSRDWPGGLDWSDEFKEILATVEKLEQEANANLPTKHYTDEIIALRAEVERLRAELDDATESEGKMKRRLSRLTDGAAAQEKRIEELEAALREIVGAN